MAELLPTALRVDRLTKVYADGTHALDALELAVPAGSFFGLLGPNGAGKTTLIGSVAGLVRAPAGRIFILGHDAVSDLRARLLVGSRHLVDTTRHGFTGFHESPVGLSLAVAVRRGGDIRRSRGARRPRLAAEALAGRRLAVTEEAQRVRDDQERRPLVQ